MSAYRSVAPAALTDNFFSRIGEDWMLITAANSEGEVNTMTASWGCAGILWNKPVAVCFIRPQRYTYGIVEDSDTLTLSFFPAGEYREALRCCKLYADDLKENAFIDPEMLKHYAAKDYHRFYICEITEVLVKDGE